MNDNRVHPMYLSDVRLALLTNLRSVVYYEYEKHLGVVRLADLTAKVSMILIEKETGVIREYIDEAIESIPQNTLINTKKHEDFSAFLGIISHGKQDYLCFAKTGAHMAAYEGHSIYMVKNFVAFNRLSGRKDLSITDMLNDVAFLLNRYSEKLHMSVQPKTFHKD